MKIALNLLYLIPNHVGGTQTYAVSLIHALAALDDENEYLVFVSRDAADLELPAASNFRRIVCPFSATRREARYLWEQWVLPWQLRAYRVDLLHSLGYVGPLFPPCPQIVTIHDVNFLAIPSAMSSLRQKVLNKLVPLTARRSAHVLAVSQFSRQQIEKYLAVPASRITVTHEGPRETPVLPPEPWEGVAARYGLRGPYLLAFGSLSGHKNIERLIRAFATIAEQIPHTLVLAGHMTPGPDLAAEIESRGVPDRVQMTGYVPDSHLMPLLQRADLFVFPSLYEGFGLPVLEAQAAGVAVACSTAASLPEVAGDGAAFFDPNSVEDMARVLRECLLDPARRTDLIEKGRANVARFSWERTAAETLKCYRQVLSLLHGHHGNLAEKGRKMSLNELQKNWDTFGKIDPLWAILSSPDKKGNKWEWDKFFETGRTEIKTVLEYAASLPIPLAHRQALDFGCGAGRLTQALAAHFEQVVGIDIAPSMIDLANSHNAFADTCRYLVNATDDLKVFPSETFDLIYSNIVLQHMEPRYSAKYLQEFCRILAPHGLLLFQIPSEPTPQLKRRQRIKRCIPAGLLQMLRNDRGQPLMEMHGLLRDDVVRLVEEQKARIVDIQPDTHAPGWFSFRYAVTKD